MHPIFTTITPPGMDRPSGYSDGFVAPSGGRLLFVAGQTAPAAQAASPMATFQAQFDTALERVLAVVTEAGGDATHIGKMTVYVTSMAAYTDSRPALAGAWTRRMGAHYPAMAIVEVSRLLHPDAVVEIDATAVLP